jgi:hypothetical protein
MNWFNQNGDKLLAGIGVLAGGLAQAGVSSPWIAAAAGFAGMLHTMFWPDNPQPGAGK